MLTPIALMGRAGAGKDTLARELAERAGYTRIAFADELRKLALAINPVIAWDSEAGPVRLEDAVRRFGYNDAKRFYPELRRFLQRLGTEGVRHRIGADTWIDLVRNRVCETLAGGVPVVFTDTRFRNELAYVRREVGAVAVWIDRPGAVDGRHATEAELVQADADVILTNDGSPAALFDRLLAALAAK